MSFLGLKFSRKDSEENKQRNQPQCNVSKSGQVKFAIPYFDVFDPRLTTFGVPVAVHGLITYTITDMDFFLSINNEAMSDEEFQQKLRDSVARYVKGIVSNAPTDAQIPVEQLDRKIMEINNLVFNGVCSQVERAFGVTIRSLDITKILIDKDSHGYRELRSLTANLEKENVMAKHQANLSNFNLQNSLNQEQLKTQSSLSLDAMRRQQELNLKNQEQQQIIDLANQRETLRIQREEMQRASKLQTEQTFLDAHQADLNAELLNNATDKGFNVFQQQQPQGGVQGLQMVGTPKVSYILSVNEQQVGPFDWEQLKQLVQGGQLTQQTLVWTQGMSDWQYAGLIQELQPLFMNAAPTMGGMPSMSGL